MLFQDVVIRGESPMHDAAIHALHEEAFGPGRFARAAERVREGGGHDPTLSFVALRGEELLGSVRMTPIVIGAVRENHERGHLLGPLAVRPDAKHHGVGRALIERAATAACGEGSAFTLLVGDLSYYGRHGFVPIKGPILPGPVDPTRLLVRWHGEAGPLTGPVIHAARGMVRRPNAP